MEETKVYSKDEFDTELVITSLKEIISILEEKGYNPYNQIVGYLMSGDPGYITSYKNARALITSIDRSRIIEVLVKKL